MYQILITEKATELKRGDALPEKGTRLCVSGRPKLNGTLTDAAWFHDVRPTGESFRVYIAYRGPEDDAFTVWDEVLDSNKKVKFGS